jgi:hypothetical protein
MKMTPVQYLKESGVATSAELISLAKSDKKAFDELKAMAIEQAGREGIVLEILPATK